MKKRLTVDDYINQRSETLAEALRIELARRGWTAEDLHEKTGVSMSQISHIKNGKTNPKFETLCRIEYAIHSKLI